MTTLTSKVPKLRSFQTHLLNVEEALSLANGRTLPEMMLRIQTSFNIYGGPTTCQTLLAWGNPFLRLDRLPRWQLLASILSMLNAKFLDASEEVTLFRQQTNILLRGSENNAIDFSFLPTIFHSYVMCVLQSSGQARKQKAATSLPLMQSGPGAKALCQVIVDLLDALT